MCSAGLQFFIIAGQVEYEKGVCRLAGITRSQLVRLYLKTEFYCHQSFKTIILHFFFFETVAEILVVFKSVNFISHWRYFQNQYDGFCFVKFGPGHFKDLNMLLEFSVKSLMCYIFHNKQTQAKQFQFYRSKGS